MNYILWGIAWVNIQMMLADAPRYISDYKQKSEPKPIESEEELAKVLGVE